MVILTTVTELVSTRETTVTFFIIYNGDLMPNYGRYKIKTVARDKLALFINMGKKIVFLMTGGLVGILISASVLPQGSKASILDNIVNVFRFGGPIPLTTSTQETQEKKSENKQETVLYKPVADYENMVVRAIEEAEPSVVSIVISKDLPIIENCPYDPFGDLPPDARDFFGGGFGFEFQRPCEKGREKREVGGGSGFIVSSDGLIITNKHVVRDSEAEYTVLTNDGRKLPAKVLARNPVQDIAVIKVESSGLKAAMLGDSDSVKLGQTAIAIGNALGEFRNTVSVGVISGLARNITASGEDFSERIEGLIQTDAAINQGNSGGPLLNLKGEVIGVNTAVVAGAENIGFAIPINQIKRGVDSVKTSGRIKIPYLGVRYTMVTPELAKTQKLPVDYGALVRGSEDGPAVMPNSPAYTAGIKAEDVIIEVNGDKIDKENSLGSVIQRYSIGDVLSLKIRRGTETLSLKAMLKERSEE